MHSSVGNLFRMFGPATANDLLHSCVLISGMTHVNVSGDCRLCLMLVDGNGNDKGKERHCDSLIMCIVTTLNEGLRNGGGIGDVLRKPSSMVAQILVLLVTDIAVMTVTVHRGVTTWKFKLLQHLTASLLILLFNDHEI